MKSLFSHLPAIWKDLDIKTTQVVDGKGLLERFLNVGDAGFQQIEDYIKEFLRSHNSEEIRDQFLPLLIDLTGEYWRETRGRRWNRNRIQSSVPRASYKGSHLCILDLAREYGASYCDIKDMSSTVLIESKQGTYGHNDSWFFDSDYYHPGVFQLYLSDDIDLAGFTEDFKHIRPTGTKWYLRIVIQDNAVVMDQPTWSLPQVIVDEGNNTYGTRFYLEPYGVFEYYDWVPQGDYTTYLKYTEAQEDVTEIPSAGASVEMVTYSVPVVFPVSGAETLGNTFVDPVNGYYEYSDWVPQEPVNTEYVTVIISEVLVTLEMASDSTPIVTVENANNTYGTGFYDSEYEYFEYFDWVPQLGNIIE